METFSALLALCEGNSPVTGEFPSQRPVTQSLDVFFDLRMNKRLSKQSKRRWFETPPRSLWRHCNELEMELPDRKQEGTRKRSPNYSHHATGILYYELWKRQSDMISKGRIEL